jgi:mRNA interferase MazF
VGAEIQNTRPALIIQNDVANRWSPVTIVVAITSRPDAPAYPADVRVDPPEGNLSVPSVVLLT